MVACSAPSAPEFSIGWQPVNQFDAEITVIPKTRPYLYEAIKLDTTLSGMLERWAKDSKIKYNNDCDSDYTLSVAMASLQANSLDIAIKLVNEVYAKQNVKIIFFTNGVLSLTCKPIDVINLQQP